MATEHSSARVQLAPCQVCCELSHHQTHAYCRHLPINTQPFLYSWLCASRITRTVDSFPGSIGARLYHVIKPGNEGPRLYHNKAWDRGLSIYLSPQYSSGLRPAFFLRPTVHTLDGYVVIAPSTHTLGDLCARGNQAYARQICYCLCK